MLTFTNRWTVIYLLVVLMSIFLLLNEWGLAFMLFKPLILPVLIGYLFIQYKTYDHQLIPLLLVAVFFSILGDILIIIPIEKSFFTIIAICTFIVSQACYGLMFYLSTAGRSSIGTTSPSLIPELSLAFVFVISVLVIKPYLGNYLFPILIYAFFNLCSLFFALKRRRYVPTQSFITVMTGLLFFYISDMLTAYDLSLENNIIHACIIASYSTAHFLVIKGMMVQIQEEIKEKKTPC
mgnify:CR=1 FL=1